MPRTDTRYVHFGESTEVETIQEYVDEAQKDPRTMRIRLMRGTYVMYMYIRVDYDSSAQ